MVPQGSVLGPLLSLIFINALNLAITQSKMFHSEDDAYLLNLKGSMKQKNKFVNKDLKLLPSWLIAKRISLNVKKAVVVLFKQKGTNHT